MIQKLSAIPERWLVDQNTRKHTYELRTLLVLFRLIKSKIMRWAGHVACMRERRGVYRVLVENPEGKETTWKSQA